MVFDSGSEVSDKSVIRTVQVLSSLRRKWSPIATGLAWPHLVWPPRALVGRLNVSIQIVIVPIVHNVVLEGR